MLIMSLLKTVIIGDEYDDALIEKLRDVLKNEGVKVIEKKWGIGGSQEIAEYYVIIKNENLKIEIETYIGISITGKPDLVDSIVDKIA